MAHTRKVQEILSWYRSDNPGTLANLARMLNTGRLAGTGKMVILPVDQGFEHGPARSFAPNPAGYDPRYHIELAIESGCNAYAAPLGFIEAVAADFAGAIPMILKLNNSDGVLKLAGLQPASAVTSCVEAALRLGCAAIGYTIYPGSGLRNEMYEALAQLTEEAKGVGLAVVVWSYPRGGDLSVDPKNETAIDVSAYAAHIAAQLGAHILKVKPSNDSIWDPKAKPAYANIPIASLADRTRHVVQSAFGGRRIVIFSGGEAKGTEAVLQEIRDLADGGAFGSIVGRNSFQRPRTEAIELLHQIQDIYRAAARARR